MCGNYLDDDLKCYECEDCNMKHPTEDAFDVFNGTYTVKSDDPVNNPKHYNRGGIECIDAIEAALDEGFEYYLQGNVMKYLWRYRYKNGAEDLKKAEWYNKKLIELKEKK